MEISNGMLGIYTILRRTKMSREGVLKDLKELESRYAELFEYSGLGDYLVEPGGDLSGTMWYDVDNVKILLIRPSTAQPNCYYGFSYKTNDNDYWYLNQLKEPVLKQEVVMTEQEIDELIETVMYKRYTLLCKCEDDRKLYELALATLKDHKNGLVSVPSENPITEQLKAMFDCGDDAPWIDLYKSTIKAAPQSETSKILGGNYD